MNMENSPATTLSTTPDKKSWFGSAASRLKRLPVFGVLVGSLIALGGYLRVHAFGFPTSLLFDERHFVTNAENYLSHRPDWNDHPPLGKLLIALSIVVFGDDPLGWRAPALFFGLIVIVLGGLAVARLFRGRRAGLLAAALLSSDGFCISYSRVGLLDGYLAACAIMALYLSSFPFTLSLAFIAGLLGGLACGIKFSGIAVLAPILISLALSGLPLATRLDFGGIILVMAAGIYVVQFMIGLSLAHQSATVTDVAQETLRLLKHHAALTDMTNPWTSGWTTWALPLRPILIGYIPAGGTVRILSTIGNLATWWMSVVIASWVGLRIAWQGLAVTISSGRLPEPAVADSIFLGNFLSKNGRAALIILSTGSAFLAPWILTRRDSYIYHFLPTYTTLVLLLAGFLSCIYRRRPTAVILFLSLVLAVGLFYAPVWSFLPLTPRDSELRLVLPSWR